MVAGGRSLVAVRRPCRRPRHGHRATDQRCWWRAEGFEPPTARSVVSHHPSPPVLLLPWRPRWSWSTGMLLIRLGHMSLPVTRGLVAIWSQFRAAVARLGVWQQVALLATLPREHQIQDLVLYPSKGREPIARLVEEQVKQTVRAAASSALGSVAFPVGYGSTKKPASSLSAGPPTPAADIRGLPIAVSPGTGRAKATLLDRLAITILPGSANRSWPLGRTGGAARVPRSTWSLAGGAARSAAGVDRATSRV